MAVLDEALSRRALMVGGVVAASPLFLPPLTGHLVETANAATRNPARSAVSDLPIKQIEGIMQTTGTVQNGVLTIELDRNDLKVTGPLGIPFKPSFELTHEFYFQSMSSGRAFLNAEMTFIGSERNRIIDAVLHNGLDLMAEHQHFIGESPQTFHIHFRGEGDPLQLARAAIAVVRATGTPLPQTQPSNPTTPLPKDQIAKILGGSAQVASDGIVSVDVERADSITVAGVPLNSDTGVLHTIAFEPLGNGRVACAPDYALISSEVTPVLKEARLLGFEVHCLYNQETAENPQLYFSHQLAVGDPLDVARKVRKVLDKSSTKPS